jgi:hypothetical protein
MNRVNVAEASLFECSPETPWGMHQTVRENVCPRCGWIARPEAAGEADIPPIA